MEAASRGVGEARLKLDRLIGESALGALLDAQAALNESRAAYERAIQSAGPEDARERVRRVAGEPPDAAMPPLHFCWLADVLLRLPALEAAVRELHLFMAQQQAR
jgi:hypothetical protein